MHEILDMTGWLTPIDIYCERLDASWWAEPVNALTNLAFVIAGLLIVTHRQTPAALLGALIAMIGVGSFLFHTHANRLTGLIDITFIGVYLATYAWLWPKWVWNKAAHVQAGSVLGLLGLILLASLTNQLIANVWPDVPPGVYLGALLYVMALAVFSASNLPADTPTNTSNARMWLWTTAGLFLASLTARQLDMPLCEHTGGTHWLWHLLNAGVLYASARALLAGSCLQAALEPMRQIKA